MLFEVIGFFWIFQLSIAFRASFIENKSHGHKRSMGIIGDLRNLLELADRRNVPIGLRGDERRLLFSRGATNGDEVLELPTDLKTEEEQLQQELHYIEAIEQRNEAQLGSFIDAKHQWEFQSQEDRDMLLNKNYIVQRLEKIREILSSISKDQG